MQGTVSFLMDLPVLHAAELQRYCHREVGKCFNLQDRASTDIYIHKDHLEGRQGLQLPEIPLRSDSVAEA